IVQTNSDQEKMVMGKLGKHKNTRWEFQKEFRYVLIVIPTNLKNLANSYEQVYLNMVNPNYINPISLFTLDIDDEAFSEMEVTLSPNISTGNQTIVELMKKSWNPSMIILESDLSGKLR
ncbi:MAG: hypothetical protein GX811_07620, partial [Lentisphaerae bacterium]|nr:hypothetical protein [Lentisphaerota bacterium]